MIHPTDNKRYSITINIIADDEQILNNCYNLIEQYLSTLTNNDTFLSSSKIQIILPLPLPKTS